MPDKQRSIMGQWQRCGAVLLVVWIVLAALVRPALAGMPQVSQFTVADVTPRSFTVSWLSSEPAFGSLNLFQSDCTTALVNPALASEQSDRTGIIRVTVAELAANTSYCYKTVTTSTSTAEITVYPATPLLLTTEKRINRVLASSGQNLPAGNDLLRVPAPYLPALTDGQEGILVFLQLLDGAAGRPLSLLLTADPIQNYFTMNNLFDNAGVSINLTGGERVRITEQHGLLGCTIDRFRLVPPDQEGTRIREVTTSARPADIDGNAAIDILDVIRVARGNWTATGAACFNSDLDLNGDGSVNSLDLDAVIGGFDATP